jgi:hypothetical protein
MRDASFVSQAVGQTLADMGDLPSFKSKSASEPASGLYFKGLQFLSITVTVKDMLNCS